MLADRVRRFRRSRPNRPDLDQIPLPVYRTTPEGRIVAASQALADVLGYQCPDDLLDVSAPNLYVDHSDRTRLRAALEKDGVLRGWECQLRRADGEPFWASLTTTVTKDRRGRPAEYVGVLFDVTRCKELESYASAREAQYRNLFIHAPLALWEEDLTEVEEWLDDLRSAGVSDLAMFLDTHPEFIDEAIGHVRVIDANPAAVTLIGAASVEELVRRGFPPRLLGSGERSAATAQLAALWEGRAEVKIEVEIAETIGSAHQRGRFLILSAAPDTPEGAPDFSRTVVAVVDVSDAGEARSHLESLLQSREEFLRALAHQLRTPLTAVAGLSQLMDDEWEELEMEDRKDLIGLVAEHSRELVSLVDDMVVAARIRDGRLSVVPQVVSLSEVVRSAVRGFERTGGLQIEVSGDAHAWADPLRVRQILRNLITNALRYGRAPVRIALSRNESDAHVQVRDGGPGLDADTLAGAFRPFHRFGTTPTSPGTLGLGLAVSRTLARLMDGDLTYHREGDETVFDLRLPPHPPGGIV